MAKHSFFLGRFHEGKKWLLNHTRSCTHTLLTFPDTNVRIHIIIYQCNLYSFWGFVTQKQLKVYQITILKKVLLFFFFYMKTKNNPTQTFNKPGLVKVMLQTVFSFWFAARAASLKNTSQLHLWTRTRTDTDKASGNRRISLQPICQKLAKVGGDLSSSC